MLCANSSLAKDSLVNPRNDGPK